MKAAAREAEVDVNISSALRRLSTMPLTILGRVPMRKPTVLVPMPRQSPTSSLSFASCSSLCRESGDNCQTLSKSVHHQKVKRHPFSLFYHPSDFAFSMNGQQCTVFTMWPLVLSNVDFVFLLQFEGTAGIPAILSLVVLLQNRVKCG